MRTEELARLHREVEKLESKRNEVLMRNEELELVLQVQAEELAVRDADLEGLAKVAKEQNDGLRREVAQQQRDLDCARKWARHFRARYLNVTVLCRVCELFGVKELLDAVTRLQIMAAVQEGRADHWEHKYQEIEDDPASVCEQCAPASQLEQLQERLVMLQTYLQHQPSCELRVKTPPAQCTCGLTELELFLMTRS